MTTTATAKGKAKTSAKPAQQKSKIPVTKNQLEKEQKNEPVTKAEPAKQPEKEQEQKKEVPEIVSTGRNFDKFVMNDEPAESKSRMLLKIVTRYVSENPETTFKKLKEIFPDSLLPSYGVFTSSKEAEKKPQRYFIKESEKIKLVDATVCCSNQVSGRILADIIMIGKSLGYKIRKAVQ